MLTDYDKPPCGMMAYGSPYRGYPAKYAAEQLLTKLLEDESHIGWVASPPWHVMKPGLLDSDDIQRIGSAVFAS